MTYSKLRWVLLAYLHLALIALAVYTAANMRPTPGGLLFSLVLPVVAVMACATDARVRGHSIPHGLQFIMLVFWTLSPAVYLLWSRKWWGVLGAILLAISLFLCLIIAAAATMLVSTEFAP